MKNDDVLFGENCAGWPKAWAVLIWETLPLRDREMWMKSNNGIFYGGGRDLESRIDTWLKNSGL